METTNRRLVAVFSTGDDAERAIERAVDAGVSRDDIQMGDAAERASMRAEMRQELEGSLISPQAAVALPNEAAKGALGTSLLYGVACAVALMVLAPFLLDDMNLLGRLAILGGIGFVAGSTIGIVVGPGFAAKGPNEPIAAERGIPVSVPLTNDRVREIFMSAGAIRVDEVTDAGEPIINLSSEGDGQDRSAAQRTADDLADSDGGSRPFNRN